MVSGNALAVALMFLLLLSGIAGITVGGPSAQAGWWLVAVSGALLVALAWTMRRA